MEEFDDEDDDERFLSHGISESGCVLGAYEEDDGLVIEDVGGLGWYEPYGLGWYDEQGLADADPPMSIFSKGLHPWRY